MDLPIKYSYEVLEVLEGTPSDSPQALGLCTGSGRRSALDVIWIQRDRPFGIFY